MVLVAAVCFGGIPVYATLATRAGADLGGLLAWRYLLGAALLALHAGPRALVAPGQRALVIVVVAGAMQAAVAYVSLSSLRYIPAATLTFLFYSYPAMIALLAAATGQERLTPHRAAALAMALAGIATMVGGPGGAALDVRGVGLALGSAFLYALYVPLLGRLQRGVTPAAVSTYAAGGAALVFLGTALALRPAGLALPVDAWPWAGLLALFGTALGFVLFFAGLEVLQPVRTAILCTLEPFATAVLGALLLGQAITGGTMLGGALIAAAVVLLQWTPRDTAGVTSS